MKLFQMRAALKSKRLLSLLTILSIIAFSEYYVTMYHEERIPYMKNTLNVEIKNLRGSNNSRNEVTGPLHIHIVSYGRSGSSFLGEILQSHPRAFYFYEPLRFLGNKFIFGTNRDILKVLHNLFRCQVSHIREFLSWRKKQQALKKLHLNAQYWNSCFSKGICYNSTYLDSSCSNHSAVVIKTIRMGLREASSLYSTYRDLNLKIIYLVRDPRGTFNSRANSMITKWCKECPKCYDPKMFCAELDDDLNVACSLLSSRPETFMVLRFEDLARNPFRVAERIFRFLGLEWNEQISHFLRTHTAISAADIDMKEPYSTFRNSSAVTLKWRQELSFARVTSIQKDCKNVLLRMRYNMYNTSAEIKSHLNYDRNLNERISNFCSDLIK